MNLINKMYCRSYQLVFKMAIPFLPYRSPKILNDISKINEICKQTNIKKLLVVTDEVILNSKTFIPMQEELAKQKINYTIFDKVKPNPTISLVEEAKDTYIKENCDGIVAIGGGSVIDLAKACGARIVRPNRTIQDMKGLLHVRRKLPTLFVIPTTAGTGSETTLAAVIIDEKTHHKYPINDFSLIPHYAILDPKFIMYLPKDLTATTGMDALTHAVEAFIGRSTTKKTRQMAIEAVKIIAKNLEISYKEPFNLEARKEMLYASHYAGIAFTISYVGYVHAIAHSLGGRYGIAHGYANAIILPIFLQYYGKAVYHKLAILAKAAGISSPQDDDTKASQLFIDWIYDLNKRMGIPRNITTIRDEDIPQMAQYAISEANPLYPVPKELDYEQLKSIYNVIRG